MLICHIRPPPTNFSPFLSSPPFHPNFLSRSPEFESSLVSSVLYAFLLAFCSALQPLQVLKHRHHTNHRLHNSLAVYIQSTMQPLPTSPSKIRVGENKYPASIMFPAQLVAVSNSPNALESTLNKNIVNNKT